MTFHDRQKIKQIWEYSDYRQTYFNINLKIDKLGNKIIVFCNQVFDINFPIE